MKKVINDDGTLSDYDRDAEDLRRKLSEVIESYPREKIISPDFNDQLIVLALLKICLRISPSYGFLKYFIDSFINQENFDKTKLGLYDYKKPCVVEVDLDVE